MPDTHPDLYGAYGPLDHVGPSQFAASAQPDKFEMPANPQGAMERTSLRTQEDLGEQQFIHQSGPHPQTRVVQMSPLPQEGYLQEISLPPAGPVGPDGFQFRFKPTNVLPQTRVGGPVVRTSSIPPLGHLQEMASPSAGPVRPEGFTPINEVCTQKSALQLLIGKSIGKGTGKGVGTGKGKRRPRGALPLQDPPTAGSASGAARPPSPPPIPGRILTMVEYVTTEADKKAAQKAPKKAIHHHSSNFFLWQMSSGEPSHGMAALPEFVVKRAPPRRGTKPSLHETYQPPSHVVPDDPAPKKRLAEKSINGSLATQESVVEVDSLVTAGPTFLNELLAELAPHCRLTPETEQFMLRLADSFLGDLTKRAAAAAKHRGQSSIGVQDLECEIAQSCNIRVAGVLDEPPTGTDTEDHDDSERSIIC
ncbi:uncharacterized protein EV422DRAFT_217586 [Fimicolochytrium jonesii]|uniref:uncharacterized protein n=1 Tax=Fimicolochytrium jonesii TaxID=1396493 RepID=UPI0022FF3A80|nr:uncharacterized protein EV422DRAFT_217586 [Fimicolochytrium jonesii]KAI8817540.1 hypothetical protein EV422DRAFT_217586 [Fimicolochytrium jonesii]